jgi:hypothetical protein
MASMPAMAPQGGAANPACVPISYARYLASRPLMLIAMIAFLVLGVAGVVSRVLTGCIPAAVALWAFRRHMQLARATLLDGRVCPAVVVSKRPWTVAVWMAAPESDSGYGPESFIVIARAPLRWMIGGTPHIGQRTAAATLSQPARDGTWYGLQPIIVGCVTADHQAVGRVMASISDDEWGMLNDCLGQIREPEPGIYRFAGRGVSIGEHRERKLRFQDILPTIESVVGGLFCAFVAMAVLGCTIIKFIFAYRHTSRFLMDPSVWPVAASMIVTVVLDGYFLFLLMSQYTKHPLNLALAVAGRHRRLPLVVRPFIAAFWLAHLLVSVVAAVQIEHATRKGPMDWTDMVSMAVYVAFLTYAGNMFLVMAMSSLTGRARWLEWTWRLRLLVDLGVVFAAPLISSLGMALFEKWLM